jgi:hypothetical protein
MFNMDIWWLKFILLMAITVGLTWFFVWCRSWIIKKKEKHPTLYKHRFTLGMVVYLLLSR